MKAEEVGARPSEQQLFEGWRKYWDAVKKENNVGNQVTMGFGFNQQAIGQKFIGAKQKGRLPDFVCGMAPPPGWYGESIIDGRADVLQTGTLWSASNETGVHAEVLVIRAWLVFYQDTVGASLEEAFEMLKRQQIYISASQAPCWCCEKLMESMGIHFDRWNGGSKPSTGWRHPLSGKTVPNADIPNEKADITAEWLEQARRFA